ncbi:MAG: type VI secretion system ATPase TssH [Phycisphaerales bacterium]|nr:type VI secretion system ATPase TssH [Phycisphaerales bacterium]
MAEIPRASLFGKLNSIGYKSIESATVFCKLRGNPYVELVHFINQILQLQDTDLHHIIRHYACDPSRLAKDMTAALDRLPRGATSISDLSQHLEDSVERAWVYGSLLFGERAVRTGHVVLGILKTPALRNVLLNMSQEFAKIKPDDLADNFGKIVAGSPEDSLTAQDGSSVGGGADPGEASGAMAPAAMGKQEALKKFSVDLTEKARKGEIDPIVGRDEEIRQIVDVLMRRRQNNPILTGEAGVGKTAVVEGFALRIAAGDVPPPLKEVSLRSLDLGLLQAGASMKGEFENRLRQVIDEVQQSPKPIILFIDEAHQLIGAGGAAGQGDAANLLKPALARGTLKTVAATTWAEYKKYFEKDPALTRRFQTINIAEPSEERALLMIRGVAGTLEKHHRVQVLDEALEAAVKLSNRYIPARQLPDKAVSLIDTACARVAIGQHAVPAEVDDSRKRIMGLETEVGIIDREQAVGVEHTARRAEVQGTLDAERARLKELETHWNQERELVVKILDIRSQLRGKPAEPVEGTGSRLEAAAKDARAKATPATAAAAPSATPPLDPKLREELLADLRRLQKELADLQGETPLILASVDAAAVSSVVADWTGIPVGRMVKNEVEAVLKLAETLNLRIMGQRHALDAIAKRIQTSRAGMENPNKPIGVFMLAGTSGVGKTETALALAEALYGNENNITVINMSEFQEAHKVATLMGSPPGYVGYGEGGVLTEAVRRRPYSIVLLDEVEKAHGDVHEVFFQVFDKGAMKDSEGRDINFRNTIILLTTNVGSDLIMNMCKDPDLLPEPEGIVKALREPMLKVFPAALLGRVTMIPYYPLTDDMIRNIIKLQLGRIRKRVKQNNKVDLAYADDVVELILSRCTERDSGGRMIDAILTHSVLPQISREYLTRLMDGRPIAKARIGVNKGEFAYDFE